jgi:hypothetical protein
MWLVAPARTDRVPVAAVRREGAGRVAVAFTAPPPGVLLWAAALGLSFDHLLGGDAGDGWSRDDWAFSA